MLLQKVKSFFLGLSSIPLYIHLATYLPRWIDMHYIFFFLSSVDRHLGCFHILAILINVAMNIGMHVSFQNSVLIFFSYLSKSGIAGLNGTFIFSF